jgi:hypothetical protein
MAKCKFFARVEPDSFWKMKSLTMRPLAELVAYRRLLNNSAFTRISRVFPTFSSSHIFASLYVILGRGHAYELIDFNALKNLQVHFFYLNMSNYSLSKTLFQFIAIWEAHEIVSIRLATRKNPRTRNTDWSG